MLPLVRLGSWEERRGLMQGATKGELGRLPRGPSATFFRLAPSGLPVGMTKWGVLCKARATQSTLEGGLFIRLGRLGRLERLRGLGPWLMAAVIVVGDDLAAEAHGRADEVAGQVGAAGCRR